MDEMKSSTQHQNSNSVIKVEKEDTMNVGMDVRMAEGEEDKMVMVNNNDNDNDSDGNGSNDDKEEEEDQEAWVAFTQIEAKVALLHKWTNMDILEDFLWEVDLIEKGKLFSIHTTYSSHSS